MLFPFRAAALSLVGSLSLVAPSLASEGWIADFDEAVKLAKAEHKDLFVDFTGSDWCGWCKKLDAEVFSKEEFLTAAKKSFVLVTLDFPRAEAIKAKVPNPQRNKELSEKYEIQGFPTLLLMTAEGEVFGQMGYMPGGPSAFVPELEKLASTGKKDLADAKAKVAEYEAATGDARMAAWDKLAEALESLPPESVAAKLYVAIVRGALEFDKDNKGGRKLRAIKALLKSGNGDESIFAAGRELDATNENGLLELCVEAQFRGVRDDETARAALAALDALNATGKIADKERHFQMNYMAAMWCAQPLDDKPRAKLFAAKAKEIGNEDPEAIGALDQILEQ
ncbi:MAG: thioredoxin family protein [Planctomycetes bacterium]|nr:thioredoxin family protein [Planctomycetota bacterium]